MIKILLVEDNDVVRQSTGNLLDEQPDMQITGSVASGNEALKLFDNSFQVDVVVTDFNMPGINGLELTRKLLKIKPSVKVIIISMNNSKTLLTQASEAGAKGYLIKGEDFQKLFKGIREVNSGGSCFSPDFRT